MELSTFMILDRKCYDSSCLAGKRNLLILFAVLLLFAVLNKISKNSDGFFFNFLFVYGFISLIVVSLLSDTRTHIKRERCIYDIHNLFLF